MKRLTTEQKDRVESLLQKMTTEEKIGQLNQQSVSIVGGFEVPFEELIEMLTDGRLSQGDFEEIMSTAKQDYHEDDIRAGRIGSFMIQDPEVSNELQRIAVEESRLGIPLIFGLDVIHGYRTVYPIAIAEACTFDTELFEKTARMAAKESRTQGVSWHFGPMVDVARDARWGRVSEGPGEDPYLVSEFAKAKVRGLQGDMSNPENYVAACLKHFVGYGACEGGRDYNTVSMADSILYNTYLPPFKAAVEEGAATVMSAFHDLNGMPCTVNSFILRDLLKDQYGLKGFVVSDANAIRECIAHGIAQDEKSAGIKAVEAGLDMDMGTGIYQKYLEQAVEEGQVEMSVLDDAVRRILSVKMWLGLFDHPYVKEKAMKRYDRLPKEHLDLALEAAEKSIVLLKNQDQILPLKEEQKISLVGQLADMREEVVGAWAISWREKDCISIKEGLETTSHSVEYFPCGGPSLDLNDEDIKKAGEYGDVIVAVVGELVSMSGEASSRADITLPGCQREMLEKLLATGKPVIAVLMNGRPLALDWEDKNLHAIVESWHLGIEMGNAVADILTGKAVPEGRLSASFPAVTGQCPVYYNHMNTGRPCGKSKFTSKYLDASAEALYPFGYGLSYTEFAYSDLIAEERENEISVRVKVKNTGNRAATETVQLYMQDVTAGLVRPVKELKGVKKLHLAPGEEKEAVLTLDKKNMGFYDNQGNYQLEDGEFRIYAGKNSKDCLEQSIEIRF